MNLQGGPPTYAVTCLYGLETTLAAEVADRLGVEGERHWCEVVFAFDGDPARLKELRLAGNVFLQFDRFAIGHTVPDLEVLASRLRLVPLELWQGCSQHFQDLPDGDISVSVRRSGDHNFTYKDVEELALDVIWTATGRKATAEPRPLQLRVDIDGTSCRLMGRLTAAPLSERPYRRYHTPGETDPTLAAAMVRLGRPRPDDVFLDPFCGGGTIPVERALAGPAAQIVAGETRSKRLGAAAANAEAAGVTVSFGRWDAFALPFRDRCFTRIVTSPPQSDPASGRPWRMEEFAGFLSESLRVLRYGGAMSWLMQRGRLFRGALKRLGITSRARRLNCSWKGRPWTIYTVDKAL